MKGFLFLLCCAFGFLIYCNYKYNNPHKLIFIFGKKGAGKSTYMVSLMLRHLKRGWHVYTNMDDVNIPSVRLFDVADLTTFVPEPHSVLFIDEGGLIWNNRDFKKFDKGYMEFFKLQRKYKCKVYINSQDFDIDKKIRQLTDSMVLMHSIASCIGLIRPIKRTVTLVEASAQAESRIADNLKFGSILSWHFIWLPSYFKYFDSYAAPHREPVPFREVLGDVSLVLSKKPLQRLKKAFRGDFDEDD